MRFCKRDPSPGGPRLAANKPRHSVGKGLRGKSITSSDVSTHLRSGQKKARGGDIDAETPFSAISRSNWSPESPELRPLLKADCSWRKFNNPILNNK
jgi:hypothetical protein